MSSTQKKTPPAPQPTAFIAFGGTSDVTRRRLYPALYALALAGLLPKRFYILGVARRGLSDAAFRDHITEAVTAALPDHAINPAAIKLLTQRIKFIAGDLTTREVYDEFENYIQAEEKKIGQAILRIFYLGLHPAIYPYVFKNVQACRLGEAMCTLQGVRSRIVIEKPFGSDLQSSKQLLKLLRETFAERQIYLLDHYIGKEAVQNILAFRFGNAIFDDVWHHNEIKSIQITVHEPEGIADRANYYEHTGALRDMVQSHLLQLLVYATMDAPKALSGEAIHAAKEAVLKSVTAPKSTDIVRGQYGAGKIDDKTVSAYRKESGVKSSSTTETYAALKLQLRLPAWRNVPIYLRTGKRMDRDVTEITYTFRPPHRKLFAGVTGMLHPNYLTIRIDPNPGIALQMNVKKPGHGMELIPTDMHFCYGEQLQGPKVGDYERLLLDVIAGDRMLFTSSAEITESWKIVDPMLKAFSSKKIPLLPYKAGTHGPKAAYDLLKRNGDEWVDDTQYICPIPRYPKK
jgi:glucose-6-phosphate 1-dehydrogenase